MIMVTLLHNNMQQYWHLDQESIQAKTTVWVSQEPIDAAIAWVWFSQKIKSKKPFYIILQAVSRDGTKLFFVKTS